MNPRRFVKDSMLERGAPAFVVAVVVLLGSIQVAAEVPEWDQDRVASLAADFAKVARGLYDTVYTDASGSPFETGGSSYVDFRNKVQEIENESRHFRDELAKGLGRKKTNSSYQWIAELMRDAEMYGGRFDMREDAKAEFAKARDLMRQISAFYDPAAALDSSQAKGPVTEQESKPENEHE